MFNRVHKNEFGKSCSGSNLIIRGLRRFVLIVSVVAVTSIGSLVIAETAILSNPVISDVSDRSFSLIWTTDQAGDFFLELYSDQAGTQQISGFNVSNYGIKTASSLFLTPQDELNKAAIVNALEAKGIAKVVVSGLQGNTTYYIKYGVIDSATTELTRCPDSGITYCLDTSSELFSVKTENKVIREFSVSEMILNDVILHIDVSAEQGEIVLISTEATDYPASTIIGDVAPTPYALIDLNNYFDASSNVSVQMSSVAATAQGNPSKALNIVRYSGINGLTNQLAVLDTALNSGNIVGVLDRSLGDCNADGNTDGYDNLLLTNYLAGVFASESDENISFHKFLCNLTLESGLNYVDADVVIDSQDLLLHNELLVGRQNTNTLPVVQ